MYTDCINAIGSYCLDEEKESVVELVNFQLYGGTYGANSEVWWFVGDILTGKRYFQKDINLRALSEMEILAVVSK